MKAVASPSQASGPHRVAADSAGGDGPQTSSRYSKWRAGTLILVYVLMVVHVVHWTVAGKTLAPLELNEVMYTFELGIVTAGFLFMLAAVLATSVFGRFFCSWGCHILALQDLSTWLLGKVGIRPKPVRSRALLWVPIAAAVYMFLWPQVLRIAEGRPMARLHFRGDAEGWASFLTENFWRNLPSPGVTVMTFLVCGFVAVYVLGSRGFCTYGCPYGAVFGLADRLAPGRIRLKAGHSCESCGICTAVCGSDVRVHEEIGRYGMIVNPRCMKDLDCVAVCPDQGLRYGWGRPSLGKAIRDDVPVRRTFDFAWWEEAVLGLVFLAVLVIFRGLYDLVPFLMCIGLGTVVAYLVVVLLRFAWQSEVKLNRWMLKRGGRLLPRGWVFLGAMCAFLALVVHSALIQYHSVQGRRHFQLAHRQGPGVAAQMGQALSDLGFVQRWGLLRTERIERMAAEVHYALAGLLFESRRAGEAHDHLAQAVRLHPGYAQALLDLGVLLVEEGDVQGGIEHLNRAVASDPALAAAHYNLAVALAMTDRLEEAFREVTRAIDLHPGDSQAHAFREHLTELRAGPP